MSGRVLRAQQDVIARYRRIANLYVAYTNSDGSPEEYGREFFIAVGELLEGSHLTHLELFHIDSGEIEDVVAYGKRETKNACSKRRRPYQQPAVLSAGLTRG